MSKLDAIEIALDEAVQAKNQCGNVAEGSRQVTSADVPKCIRFSIMIMLASIFAASFFPLLKGNTLSDKFA
jgi:hypothetical protein